MRSASILQMIQQQAQFFYVLTAVLQDNNIRTSLAKKQIKGFDKIWKHESRIKRLKTLLEKEKAIYINSIESGWERYKKQYMMHINDDNNGDA